MSELITSAAQALLPFVAGGAGAVAVGSAEEAGADLYRAATAILAKLRHRLLGEDVKQVEAALSQAMAEGLVTPEELRRLREAADAVRGSATINVGTIQAKTSLVGDIDIGTLNA